MVKCIAFSSLLMVGSLQDLGARLACDLGCPIGAIVRHHSDRQIDAVSFSGENALDTPSDLVFFIVCGNDDRQTQRRRSRTSSRATGRQRSPECQESELQRTGDCSDGDQQAQNDDYGHHRYVAFPATANSPSSVCRAASLAEATFAEGCRFSRKTSAKRATFRRRSYFSLTRFRPAFPI